MEAYKLVAESIKDSSEKNQKEDVRDMALKESEKCELCLEYAEISTEHGVVRRCSAYKKLLG